MFYCKYYMVTALTSISQKGENPQTDHIVLPYICTYEFKISKFVYKSKRYIKKINSKFSM